VTWAEHKQSIQNITKKMWEEECLRKLVAGEKGINEEDVEWAAKNKKEMVYIVVFTVLSCCYLTIVYISVFTVCTLFLPPQD